MHEKELQISGFLMFYYYKLKQKDSVIKYSDNVNNKLRYLIDSNNASEKVIKGHLHLSYILSKYYGYTDEVVTLHQKGYELSIEQNYNRGIIGHQLLKTQLILDNTPNQEELNLQLKDIELLIKNYWKYNIRHYAMYEITSKIYLAKNNYKKAEEFALKLLDTSNNFINGNRSILLTKIYYKKGNVNKALLYAKQAITSLQKSKDCKEELAEAYYYQSLCYNYIGANNKALTSINKAINNALSFFKEVNYIETMVGYLQKTNDSKKIRDLKKRKQTLINIITDKKSPKVNSSFAEEVKGEELEKSVLTLKNQLNVKFIEESALIVLLSIIILLFFYFSKKNKKQKLKASNIILQKSQEMKFKIQKKEDELQFLAMKVNNRISKFKELKNTISNNKIANRDIKKFNYLINELINTGHSLSDISNRLTSQYPGIVKILKERHPTLTNTEIRYCILTKLGFSIKDMSETLHVAPNTVKHAKSMIKKKIGFSKALSLQEYLMLLFQEKD